MDHEQAVQTEAPMRYALGELTPAERDSFEEHYADCSHCMNEVEVASAFAGNARDVFRERAGRRERPQKVSWFPWRPFPALALSAALNLLLAAGLGYGLLRFRPAASPLDVASGPESVEVVPVHAATRGESAAQVVHASGRPVVLTFDLPAHHEHYFYSIDRAGSVVLSGEVSVPGQPDSLNLQVPVARLAPGDYRVVVTGATGSAREILGSCLLQVQSR
jgi:hypothetical protein